MSRLTKRIPSPDGKNIVVYTMGDYVDTTAGELHGHDIRNILRVLAEYEDIGTLEEIRDAMNIQRKIRDYIGNTEA